MKDTAAARDEFASRGGHVGEIRHIEHGQWKYGLDPDRDSYMSFAELCDPDSHVWH